MIVIHYCFITQWHLKISGAIKYLIEQQCADPSLLARELLPISYLIDGCPEDIAIL